jgi:hypothetical protein
VTSVQCRREQYVAIRGKSRSGDISYIGICLGNKNQEPGTLSFDLDVEVGGLAGAGRFGWP